MRVMSMILTHTLLAVILRRCGGLKRTMQFEILSNDATLGGLGCALTMFDSARNIEFETTTGTCISLETDWSSVRKNETGNNYLKLQNVKHEINEAFLDNGSVKRDEEDILSFIEKWIYEAFPDNFQLGDSLVLFIQNVAGANEPVDFSVTLIDQEVMYGFSEQADYLFFRMTHNYAADGNVSIYSHVNGNVNEKKEIADPFKSDTLKVELLVREYVIQGTVDDVGFLNFSSDVPVSDRLFLEFDADNINTVCIGQQFIYRN